VFWSLDDYWYKGSITGYSEETKKHNVSDLNNVPSFMVFFSTSITKLKKESRLLVDKGKCLRFHALIKNSDDNLVLTRVDVKILCWCNQGILK
jgi:hypothetical protein